MEETVIRILSTREAATLLLMGLCGSVMLLVVALLVATHKPKPQERWRVGPDYQNLLRESQRLTSDTGATRRVAAEFGWTREETEEALQELMDEYNNH